VAGIALLLTPEPSARSLARIAVSLDDNAATAMADQALEPLRAAVPALRGLPLLDLLARGESGSVSLDYLAPLQLRVALQPC
jgi:hypothetical protein